MQDLSRVTGAPIVLRIKGEDVLVKPFTFEDIGSLQQEIMRRKRRNVIEAARDAGDDLPPEEADKLMERALSKTATINSVTAGEFNEYLENPVGIVTFFWVLIERQYPRKFTRSDITETIAEDAKFGEKMIGLLGSLAELMQKGNLTSQSTGAVAQPA